MNDDEWLWLLDVRGLVNTFEEEYGWPLTLEVWEKAYVPASERRGTSNVSDPLNPMSRRGPGDKMDPSRKYVWGFDRERWLVFETKEAAAAFLEREKEELGPWIKSAIEPRPVDARVLLGLTSAVGEDDD